MSMFQTVKNRITTGAATLAATALPLLAHAEGELVDTASITAKLTEAGTIVGAVGIGGISVYLAIKAFGYVKSALGK